MNLNHGLFVCLFVCLFVTGNSLSIEGIRALVPALCEMKQLTSLYIRGIFWVDDRIESDRDDSSLKAVCDKQAFEILVL